MAHRHMRTFLASMQTGPALSTDVQRCMQSYAVQGTVVTNDTVATICLQFEERVLPGAYELSCRRHGSHPAATRMKGGEGTKQKISFRRSLPAPYILGWQRIVFSRGFDNLKLHWPCGAWQVWKGMKV